MKKIFTISVLFMFLSSLASWAADTAWVSGVVKDSLSGLPIRGVKVVAVEEGCSTFTDQAGLFALAVRIDFPVSIRPERSSPPSSLPVSQADIKRFDLRGAMIGESRSSGVRLLTIDQKWGRIVDLRRFSHSAGATISETASRSAVLAKTAAASYEVEFIKAGYDPVSRVLSPTENAEIKLLPQGSSANINITLEGSGGTDVTVELQE